MKMKKKPENEVNQNMDDKKKEPYQKPVLIKHEKLTAITEGLASPNPTSA